MYQYVGTGNYTPTLGSIVDAGVPIFNDWWSTHIPEYKEVLEQKILHKFWFYQIGAETPDRFVYNLNQTLEEIMPYYNQLYASELIKINPMLNHAITSDKRSIENLIKDANSNTNRYSKAVRDFLEKTGTATSGTTGQNVLTTGAIDKNGSTIYNKHGEETTHGDHDTTVTHDDTVNQTYSDKEVTDMDGTQNDTVNATEKQETEKGVKNTGTVSEENEWKDVTDDVSKTTTDRDLTSDQTTSQQQDFADTPQRSLTTNLLRKDYLTNVTWTDGNR